MRSACGHGRRCGARPFYLCPHPPSHGSRPCVSPPPQLEHAAESDFNSGDRDDSSLVAIASDKGGLGTGSSLYARACIRVCCPAILFYAGLPRRQLRVFERPTRVRRPEARRHVEARARDEG